MGRIPGKPKKNKNGVFEHKEVIGHDPITGIAIRKSFTSAKSLLQAKKKAKAYVMNLKNEEAIQKIEAQLFETVAKDYLETVKGTIKDSTYSLTYKNTINKHLIPGFKNINIFDIKQTDVQKYINLNIKKYSPETIAKHKRVLQLIFQYAVDNNIVDSSPVVNIKMPKIKSVITKHIYTEEQADKILEFADTHKYGIAIILMLGYGISRSELLGIKWTDIKNKTLFIQRGVTDVQDAETGKMRIEIGEPKTDFRKREIPLYQKDIDMINSLPKFKIVGENKKKKISGEKVKAEYIITNKNGMVCSPRTWARHQYDVFMKEMHEYYLKQEPSIDIPILNPHELRHTRASLWVNGDKNLFAIANVLGHSDLKMLRKRYVHADTESNRKLLGID